MTLFAFWNTQCVQQRLYCQPKDVKAGSLHLAMMFIILDPDQKTVSICIRKNADAQSSELDSPHRFTKPAQERHQSRGPYQRSSGFAKSSSGLMPPPGLGPHRSRKGKTPEPRPSNPPALPNPAGQIFTPVSVSASALSRNGASTSNLT